MVISLLYYQSKSDPSDEVSLRDKIHRLASRYPTYGYRRITEMLVRMGYTVGYRRVARLMKADFSKKTCLNFTELRP
ncbi:MAG: IS3 family transposase [Candidatus Poribacteria bacterium]|nr:IS3 family transposase [Candidatus Poribacteria bacterium]